MDINIDIHILLSVINTKLRDYYVSIDKLVEEENINKEELIKRLLRHGYNYSPHINQFTSKKV